MTNEHASILVIDDDESFRKSVVKLLSKSFEVHEASNGKEGMGLAQNLNPDLIILDLELPDQDGIATCGSLRADPRTANIPILMLTGHDVSRLRIEAFQSGVDDFLAKPFIPAELIVRIRAKLRRFSKPETEPSDLIECGNLVAEISKMRVTVDSRPIELTTLEFKLLLVFLQNVGKILTRDEILGSIWKNTIVSPRTVDTHISILRKKLTGFNCEISSKYGSGYVLSLADLPA